MIEENVCLEEKIFRSCRYQMKSKANLKITFQLANFLENFFEYKISLPLAYVTCFSQIVLLQHVHIIKITAML